jgi:decaprenylphospho-beta-D-ribofuranose 2-oxidase
MKSIKISNWGLYPNVRVKQLEFDNLNFSTFFTDKKVRYIARGNGRCYGDASIAPAVIDMTSYKEIIDFDENEGVIKCQAGVLLDDILKMIVPRGFFLPVTPGTKFITVGGAFASDIHGKNHHVDGVFSDHVVEFEIIRPNGKQECVFPGTDLFNETAGGLGSTGIITCVTFRLKKIETAYIKQKAIRAKNLKEVFNLFDINKDFTYSVAWIDCLASGKDLGRSVLLLGEHAGINELAPNNIPLSVHQKPRLSIPIFFPGWVLNSLFVRVFNFLYYNKPSSKGDRIIHYDPYFYPLDKIHHWNRIYGRKGFVQWQCVLPIDKSYDGMVQILNALSKYRMGSFLAVLKLFGDSHEHRYLHFPMRGYTLALDIKIEPKIWSILDELDEIVSGFGGKIYLTKDARMNNDNFLKQYPNYKTKSENLSSNLMERLKTEKKQVLLVLGANSDIAKAYVKKYLDKYPDAFALLASRDIQALNKFVNDNHLAGRSTCLSFDIEDISSHTKFVNDLPFKPSVIFIGAGILVENETVIEQQDLRLRNIMVNYLGMVNIISELVKSDNPNLKRIIGLSSIAGLRGRKSNYYYGSTKAGFHEFLFGLRQHLKDKDIVVQAVTPGFVQTKMTAHLDMPKSAVTPEYLANTIIQAGNKFEIYPNTFWWIISKIVKFAPEFIISKL